MANKKISELQSRTPALSDLILVGDPSSGYSYKCTVTALATIIETDIADGFVTIGTTQTVSGAKTFSNNLTLTSVANTPTDPDKFLTLNASNVVTYRTGAEVLSDIGGQGTITLTTTGTSGAATLVGNTLNIPQYQAVLSGTGIVKSTAGTISYLTDNSTNWNSAYDNMIVSAAVTGTTTKTLTLTQQDSGTITASWSDLNTDAVTSVFGRTGAVVATEGDYSLNLLSDVTLTSPSNGQVLKYNGTAWVNDTDANTGTVTSVGLSSATSGVTIGSTPITTNGTITLAIATASGSQQGLLSSTDWSTFNNKQSAITLTTTGTSGAATLVGSTLNIPNYAPDLSGYVPTSRTLTINGTAYDLSANRSWSVGTVTSVAATAGTGISISGSPITSSGTLTITNTAPDQTVVLTAGTGISVSGTYPSFTIAATSTATISGSGTTNYIPKFTSSSAIGNSIAYIQGNEFVIQGTSNGALNIRSMSGNGNYLFFTENGVADRYLIGSPAGSGDLVFKSNSYDFSTGSERMRITSSGSVGIGTSSPAYKLDVVSTGDGASFSTNAASVATRIRNTGNNDVILRIANNNSNFYDIQNNYSDNSFTIDYNDAERLRISSTGNVGIGTSAPSVSGLTVSRTGDSYVRVQGGSANYIGLDLLQGTDGVGYLWNRDNKSILFGTNNSERMRLDASGNLGLGVSPSAWSGVKALQIGNGSLVATGNFVAINSNSFFDGVDKYISNSFASQYYQLSGQHVWQTAPSGTAGNAISFTQAMTLDASGRLGIGTTSMSQYGVTANNASNSVYFNATSGGVITYYGSATALGIGLLGTFSSNDLGIYTNSSERMRITSGGNVLIGSSIDYRSGKLVVKAANVSQTSSLANLQISTTDAQGADIGGSIGLGGQVGGDETPFGYISGRKENSTSGNYAGYLAFATQASNASISERMRITSGGNVLVGGTSDNGRRFRVTQGSSDYIAQFSQTSSGGYGITIDVNSSSSTSPAFEVYSASASTFKSRIYTDGSAYFANNVGIGTSSPQEKFVVSNGSSLNIEINPSYIQSFNRTSLTYNDLSFFSSTFIVNTGTSPTERMRLTSSGELLINTTSDAGDYKLQVNGNSYFNGSATINATTGNNDLVFLATTRPSIFVNSTNIGLQIRTNGTGVLELNGDNSATGDVNINNALIYVDASASNVGIGTNAPSAKLEVNGAIKTAAPSGGTAGAWKLGTTETFSCTPGGGGNGFSTTVVRIDIGGTAYFIPTVTDGWC